MKGFNKVVIVGNLARDPERSSAYAPVRFTVAVNKSYRDGKGELVSRCDFIPCCAWGKLGDEVVMRYLHKGDAVLAEGELRVQSFDDAKSGAKRWSTDVNVSNVVLLGGKRESGGSAAAFPAAEAAQGGYATADCTDGLFSPEDGGMSAGYAQMYGGADIGLPF